MSEECYLIENYDLSQFSFSKPKLYKNSNVMVSKIKNKERDLLIQFPKMEVVSDYVKYLELEFKTETKYNKKVYDFLSNIDNVIMEHISSNSKEWFGKKIPHGNIATMYNNFIKPPKTSESSCTLNFTLSKESNLIDKKNEKIEITDIKKNNLVQCIAQMKYLVFSKDTCFVTWEICTAKYFKKNKKYSFAFIEDPDDVSIEDEDNIDIKTFF